MTNQSGPLTLSQEIWCPAQGQNVKLEVVQLAGETDKQTIDGYFKEKAALEASCQIP